MIKCILTFSFACTPLLVEAQTLDLEIKTQEEVTASSRDYQEDLVTDDDILYVSTDESEQDTKTTSQEEYFSITLQYDAAGNRVKRAVEKSNPLPMQSPSSPGLSPSLSDYIDGRQFSISSRGDFWTISFSKWEANDLGTVRVYTSSGAIVTIQHIHSADTNINKPNRPSGVYLFAIELNGATVTKEITY